MPENAETGGLWKRHFHWSVLLRWEVLGWIVGSLLAAAALLLVFDQYLGANVCFMLTAALMLAKVVHIAATASDPAWHRVLFTFLLFGVIGVGIVETVKGINRWAVKHSERQSETRSKTPDVGAPQQQSSRMTEPPPVPPTDKPSKTHATPTENHKVADARAAAQLPPYSRTESFIIDVPYYGAEDGFPVSQLMGEEDYRLNDAYGCISKILVLYAQVPPGTAIKQIAELDTNDKRAEALTQALRYCLIEAIHQRERGSSKFGISRDKGSIAEYSPAIVPPNSSDYPPDKFLSLLGTMPFGNSPTIQMLFKNRALRVPQGSNVELAILKMDENDWVQHWVFRIEKPSVFSFTVGVAPINAAMGVLPESFPALLKQQQAKYVTYSFAITMKIQIARTSNNASEVDDFKAWSDGLWAAIRDKYDIKRSS